MSFPFSFMALFTGTLLASSAGAQISFQAATSHSLLGFRPDSVATGDFDGASGIDFAVSTGDLQGLNGPNRVEIFRNQGNGTFLPGQTIFLGNDVGAAAVVAADLDGDGDLDLAVTLKNTNMLQVLINTGGLFALGASTAVGGLEPAHMAVADIDGDGDMDLVTSNRASDNLSVLRNNGSGVFTLAGVLAVGADPRFLALDDLNGDCRTDIAVAAHNSRRVDVLFNLGAGTFGPVNSFPVPGNQKPSGMVAMDLDADGDVDLATTTDNDAGQGIVVVMRNVGGTFTSTNYLSGGVNPSGIVAGDFDADGDKDLAAVDEAANLVSALPNLGTGTFGAASTFPVGTFPEGIATADFDGNGSLDLVTANRDSNNVSVLLNAGVGGTNNYCVTAPNSAGYGTRIDSTGSLSVGTNNFTLLVRCAPSNTTGLFFYGHGITNVPFGNGHRCVLAPLFRLGPPTGVDATGHLSRHVDFTLPPVNSGPGAMVAGSTVYVQFWHRDVAGGGSLFNLSDGLRATFRP